MGVPWNEQGNGGLPTKTQAAYLGAIATNMSELGRAPTLADLAKWYGVSRQAAFKVVRSLRAKGFLGAGYRGQMTLTDKGRKALGGVG